MLLMFTLICLRQFTNKLDFLSLNLFFLFLPGARKHYHQSSIYSRNGDIIFFYLKHYLYVDELKIYVDENGTLMGTYGQFEVWKYEAIVLLVFGVIMLFSAIFVLGAGFVAGNIMTSAGLGIWSAHKKVARTGDCL